MGGGSRGAKLLSSKEFQEHGCRREEYPLGLRNMATWAHRGRVHWWDHNLRQSQEGLPGSRHQGFSISLCAPWFWGGASRVDGSQPPGPLPQDGPLPAVFSTGILLSLPWTGSAAPKVCCLKLDRLTESNHLDLQLKKTEAWRGKVTCPGPLGYCVVSQGGFRHSQHPFLGLIS